MPTANAISVAVGIPQPVAAAVPPLNAVKIMAGIIIPPKAAMTGSNAFLNEESWPTSTSRLISRPTVKKKITINISLMNLSTVRSFGNTQSMVLNPTASAGLWMDIERLVLRKAS